MIEAEGVGEDGGEDPGRFQTERGRADLNPFVDRLKEHGDWALRSDEGEACKGRWREVLGIDAKAPLLLEIGPGNGFFFRELGRRFPEAGLVAIEVRFKRVWLTTKKALGYGLGQFRIVHHHSQHLDLLFAEGELSCVVANHPDPWPKDRHHKHRLLQPSFAEIAASRLERGGELWLKSDFAPYLPLALEVFGGRDWRCIAQTNDLHGAGAALRLSAPPLPQPEEGTSRFHSLDLQTNYERKSLEAGRNIVAAGFLRVD